MVEPASSSCSVILQLYCPLAVKMETAQCCHATSHISPVSGMNHAIVLLLGALSEV